MKLSDSERKRRNEVTRLRRAANRDYENAKARRWRAENREHVNAYARRRRAEQGDKVRRLERIAKKKWREGNPEKVRSRTWRRRLRRYGLTPERYEQLWASQDNRCGICGTIRTENVAWHIDHNHATGKVRGILCQMCNNLLGSARDKIVVLEAAKQYLIEAENVVPNGFPVLEGRK